MAQHAPRLLAQLLTKQLVRAIALPSFTPKGAATAVPMPVALHDCHVPRYELLTKARRTKKLSN
jgi:hypothetical protein